MADPNMVNYIRNSLSQGYSPDSIRQALVQQGWDQESIGQAFTEAGGSGAGAQSPMQGQAGAQPGKRPMLVTILCVIGFIFSAIAILAGIATLVLGSLFGALGGTVTINGEEGAEAAGVFGSLVMLASIVPLVTGALGIVAFALLLMMKRIGFFFTIALGVISIVLGIFTLNVLGIAFWIFAMVVVVVCRKDFH
jgi:hypothetical protein